MDEQMEALEGLVLRATELRDDIAAYVERWPSARVSWRGAAVGEMISALRTEGEKVLAKRERDEARASSAPAAVDRREYSDHVRQMAAAFRREDGGIGISPAEFVEWQAKQQQRLRSAKSLEEQMREAPVLG